MRALRWERTLVHRFAEQMAVRTAYAGSEAHDFHPQQFDGSSRRLPVRMRPGDVQLTHLAFCAALARVDVPLWTESLLELSNSGRRISGVAFWDLCACCDDG